jgi:hypothetical protein
MYYSITLEDLAKTALLRDVTKNNAVGTHQKL